MHLVPKFMNLQAIYLVYKKQQNELLAFLYHMVWYNEDHVIDKLVFILNHNQGFVSV